jgi:hypothetical protein
MQTKYTAMLAPAAILWYGITHRRIGAAILACAVSAAMFAGWEAFLSQKYGESHFLHHLAEQRAESGNWLLEKTALIPGLAGHLGLLGFGMALAVARPLGVPGRAVSTIALMWCAGVVLVCEFPDIGLRARTFWRPVGIGVLVAACAAGGKLLLKQRRLRFSRDSWFVAGWLLLELAGYFALTPFPAARRVIGICIVFGILTARVMRFFRRRTPMRGVLALAIVTGLFTSLIDTYDAGVERIHAESAAAIPASHGTTWFAGHWGFQYYCGQAGFTMLVPGRSELRPGDMLVLPLHPDDDVLHRPHIGLVPIRPPAEAVRLIAFLRFNDPWLAQTIPNFYGGNEPITKRTNPRMAVAVYRVVQSWKVPAR